eukprot:TRINITY_DN6170_c7_g1_i2.p5 TRINITY_DN6170_c7_g1~~TRINITY_DN6170_c7_g1_i2.p5  ORF type:complete len:199 (+),score=37.54 TRINITY_DN6170_c7_g1_i2:65-598(+)
MTGPRLAARARGGGADHLLGGAAEELGAVLQRIEQHGRDAEAARHRELCLRAELMELQRQLQRARERADREACRSAAASPATPAPQLQPQPQQQHAAAQPLGGGHARPTRSWPLRKLPAMATLCSAAPAAAAPQPRWHLLPPEPQSQPAGPEHIAPGALLPVPTPHASPVPTPRLCP